MPGWIERITIPVLVAVTTAWVTVHLSLKRFHAERWWERRAEAYDRLLGALADLKRYADLKVEELEGETIAEDFKKGMSERHRGAFHELERAGILGGYTFSERTTQILTKLLADADGTPVEDPHGFFSRASRSYERAISELTASAKEDLHVGSESEL